MNGGVVFSRGNGEECHLVDLGRKIARRTC